MRWEPVSKRGAALLFAAVLSSGSAPGTARGVGDELIRPGDIVVANLGDHSLPVFDGETGTQRGLLESVDSGPQNPTGIAFGPDGLLYVASSADDRILRYDGRTGRYLGVFASGPPLVRPFSLIVGPDSVLLVSSGGSVLKYAGDGRPLGVAAGGMTQPIGLALGPDGTLYVANSTEQSVDRFDPRTGTHLGTFSRAPIPFPSDVVFGPDGTLYVSSASTHAVIRLDRTGELREIVAQLPDEGVPMGLAFRGGRLIIGDFAKGRIFAADPERPASLSVLSDRGLARPENVAIRPATR